MGDPHRQGAPAVLWPLEKPQGTWFYFHLLLEYIVLFCSNLPFGHGWQLRMPCTGYVVCLKNVGSRVKHASMYNRLNNKQSHTRNARVFKAAWGGYRFWQICYVTQATKLISPCVPHPRGFNINRWMCSPGAAALRPGCAQLSGFCPETSSSCCLFLRSSLSV